MTEQNPKLYMKGGDNNFVPVKEALPNLKEPERAQKVLEAAGINPIVLRNPEQLSQAFMDKEGIPRESTEWVVSSWVKDGKKFTFPLGSCPDLAECNELIKYCQAASPVSGRIDVSYGNPEGLHKNGYPEPFHIKLLTIDFAQVKSLSGEELQSFLNLLSKSTWVPEHTFRTLTCTPDHLFHLGTLGGEAVIYKFDKPGDIFERDTDKVVNHAVKLGRIVYLASNFQLIGLWHCDYLQDMVRKAESEYVNEMSMALMHPMGNYDTHNFIVKPRYLDRVFLPEPFKIDKPEIDLNSGYPNEILNPTKARVLRAFESFIQNTDPNMQTKLTAPIKTICEALEVKHLSDYPEDSASDVWERVSSAYNYIITCFETNGFDGIEAFKWSDITDEMVEADYGKSKKKKFKGGNPDPELSVDNTCEPDGTLIDDETLELEPEFPSLLNLHHSWPEKDGPPLGIFVSGQWVKIVEQTIGEHKGNFLHLKFELFGRNLDIPVGYIIEHNKQFRGKYETTIKQYQLTVTDGKESWVQFHAMCANARTVRNILDDLVFQVNIEHSGVINTVCKIPVALSGKIIDFSTRTE